MKKVFLCMLLSIFAVSNYCYADGGKKNYHY